MHKRTTPPPPGDSYQTFKGISAVSASDIWAVGYSQWSYFYGYRYAPLTYHWDGTSWSWIPNAGTVDENLFAVTAIAANDAWAVGDNGQTQHWNGAEWSRVAAPYPGLGGRFNGVAAASARDVWAVGYFNDGNQNLTWIDIRRHSFRIIPSLAHGLGDCAFLTSPPKQGFSGSRNPVRRKVLVLVK